MTTPIGPARGWRDGWTREAAYLAVCVAAALALTWPLAAVFTTEICGDVGDPYQTLWGMHWIREALLSGVNPFWTPLLHHPHGATLVLQTFDLPMAVLVVPLWSVLPPVAVYNTAVLVAFTLTAYGMFRLARELTDDTAAALAAGVMFTAVPYHMAHLQAHLHLLSMGWVPLYLVHLLRLIGTTRPSTAPRRDAMLAGLFLALAALAAWYHLLFAFVVTVVLLLHAALTRPRVLLAPATLRAGATMVLTFALVAGPLLAAVLVTLAREEVMGAHDPLDVSADLYAFVFPNAAQGWRDAWGAHYLEWSGSIAEIAVYLGFTTVALAVVGAVASGVARAFGVIALVGLVLALGPRLHVDGAIVGPLLPYWYLEHFMPLLAVAGVPLRFGYLMYLGLVAAAAFGLASLRRACARVTPGAGALAVALACGLVLVEYRPRDLMRSAYPVPAPMREWARDPGDWAVLDAWDWYRPMWHAIFHRKPLVGGYLSRVPKRLDDWLHRQPVVRSLLFAEEEWRVTRIDPIVDFDWPAAREPPVGPGWYDVEWTGTIQAQGAGRHRLSVTSSIPAVLEVGGVQVIWRKLPCKGAHGCESSAEVDLSDAATPLRLTAYATPAGARVRFEWTPPGGQRAIVPASALRTADGRHGLDAVYHQTIPRDCGVDRATGRALLRELDVRYVVTHLANPCVEEGLGLPLTYEGEDVRIYEVPAS